MAKILLSEVHESSGEVLRKYAELSECLEPKGLYSLTFSTLWSGAKNPELPQIRYQLFLDKNSAHNLIDLLKMIEPTVKEPKSWDNFFHALDGNNH